MNHRFSLSCFKSILHFKFSCLSSSMKKFSLQEVYNNSKTKSEDTEISCVWWIAHINVLVCMPVHARVIACILGNSVHNAISDKRVHNVICCDHDNQWVHIKCNVVLLIYGWCQSQPEPPKITQSQLQPPKNHPEPTRASQSQPVANTNLYFILLFLLEHSHLFLWTNYS